MNEFFLKFAAPFVKSTKETFKVMLETEVNMHSPKIKTTNSAVGDITSIIGINGIIKTSKGQEDFRGLLALSFPETVYLKVASKLLGEEYSTFVPDINDVGSEIANIILGSSKPGLSEIGIMLTMTSPSSIRGQNHEISFPKDGMVVEMVVSSNLGDFQMALCCQDIKI